MSVTRGTCLILGGVKSGKSRRAEALASHLESASLNDGKTAHEPTPREVYYIATAQALDEEMQTRVNAHKASRPNHWVTIEEQINLADTIRDIEAKDARAIILVDCLTLWLTNLLMLEDDQILESQLNALELCIQETALSLIMVSNETNMGVMPMNALSRKFCDKAGVLHQRLARVCDLVELVVAGMPLSVKGNASELWNMGA